MPGNVNNVNQVLANNPSMVNSPGLVNDALSSSNPDAAATALSHTSSGMALQQSLQDHQAENGSENIWQRVFGGAAKAVTNSLAWLGKPLQEVQRDYKFIHSVYTRHGIFNGFMATAGVIGGGTLGAFFGPEGAVAGADVAASIERNLLTRFGSSYRDSVNDSNNPNYKVSFGRDFSNALSQVPGLGDLRNTDKGLGKIISGAGDIAFDFNFDPINVGFKTRSNIQQGKYLKTEDGKVITTLKGPFRALNDATQGFFERNSLKIYSPDQLDSLYQAGKNTNIADVLTGNSGKRYVRALEDIKGIINKADSPELAQMDIALKYPGLQGMTKYLTKPNAEVTIDDLHKVFLSTTHDVEMMKNFSINGASMVPNRTVLRAAASSAADKLRQWDTNDELYLRGNQANFFLPRKSEKLVIDEAGKVVNTGEMQTILPVALRPFSGDAWKSAIAGKTRTFSGYLPYTIDSKTLELSNTKFDPSDPASATSLYRIARFSLSDQMARQKTTEFMLGDLATKRDVYSSLVSEMFKAAGLPDDSTFAKNIMDKSAAMVHRSLKSSDYGPGYLSNEGASQVALNGRTTTQGAFLDQRGMFAMPDFRVVKGAMRDLGTYGKLYGRIDDFAARYTDGIFKPLALLTGGFGLRIAGSELIPAVFRFGSLDIAKSKVAGAAAKMNYKLAAGEDESIIENAIHAVHNGTDPAEYLANAAAEAEGKTVRKTIAKGLSKLASEDDLDLAARIAIATKGHMASGATFTGYGIPAEHQEFMRQLTDIMGQNAKRRFPVKTGEYSHYEKSNPKFDIHYHMELSKSATTESRKTIVADALAELKKGATADEAWEVARLKDEARIRKVQYDENSPTFMGKATKDDPYADERRTMAGYVNETPESFSSRRTDIMRNLFTGDTADTVNRKFMEDVANGKKISLDRIKGLKDENRPKAVAGQDYEMMPGPNLTERITNFGFEKIIDPIINNLSRQPLFFNHVKNEMKSLQYALDKGFISEEEATRIAMTRATYAMVPQIHNTALKTQFAVLARNYLPFYFAQEQAMRRAGSLIATNPEAFRKFQLIQQGMNNPGFVETDSSGAKHVTLPFIGELGASFLNAASMLGMPVVGGLPVNVTGNLTSLKTVLPELNVPGVSPFVSIAANTLGAIDPSLDREIKKVVGGAGFSKSYFDQLMPNSIARTVYHAIDAKETESSFFNATIAALASAGYHGKVPPADASPIEKQAFIDRIKNNAKSIMIMKALVGAVSPLSPAVSQEDPGLRDEFYKLLKTTSPATGKLMTYPEAIDKFINEHGSGAISYTVARSEGTIPGASMPYTNEAINWIQNNKDLLYSPQAVGAAFLVPQTPSLSGDAQAIHDEVIKMHLRANKTPEAFLASYYTAAGNNYIAAQRGTHDKQMDALAKAGASQQAERAQWSAFVNAYGQTNPIWWDDYSSTKKTHLAQQAMADFQQMFSGQDANGKSVKIPTGSQVDAIKGLVSDWTAHNQAVVQYRAAGASEAVKAEKDNWANYLKSKVEQDGRLNTVVNSVFARLG
jgi:hypothetical protein